MNLFHLDDDTLHKNREDMFACADMASNARGESLKRFALALAYFISCAQRLAALSQSTVISSSSA
jgi:hypothetical protein